MRLREFDLDAPDQKRRQEFREQTRCVTALFERCFPEFETGGKYWKVLVEGVAQVIRPKVRNLLGVLTVEVPFDFCEYMNANLRAEIFCVHEVDEFTAYMVIRGRDGTELKRRKLFSERPTEFIFLNNLGKLKWVSKEEVCLISKDDESWCVLVNGDQ